jgi:hypothetical protein
VNKKLLWAVSIVFITGSAFAQTDSVLYLMGRVVIEDELPIPKEFRVELVCSNRVIRQTNPSESGTFSFDIGSVRQPANTIDASGTQTQGGLKGGFARDAWDERGFLVIGGRLYLDDCIIRTTPLPGYQPVSLELGVRDLQDNPDLGVLEVKKLGPKKRLPVTISVTTAAAPPKAAKAFEKAQKELSKEKVEYSEVKKQLEKSVEAYPQFAEAWCLLGEARAALGDPAGAREAFELSIAADEDFIHPYAGLAQLELQEKNWLQAIHRARQIKQLDSDYPRGLLFDGIANYYLNRFDAAEKSLLALKEKGQATTFPIAYLHLGMIYARKGEVPLAAESLRAYLTASPPDQIPLERREQIEAQLELWEDQGLIVPESMISAQDRTAERE